jgi:hypothetical protein
MSVRGRLRRLEQQVFPAGVCPLCQLRPDAIRTIRFVLPVGSEPVEASDEPPRERCPRCNGWLGTLRFEYVVAAAPPPPGTPFQQIVHESEPPS